MYKNFVICMMFALAACGKDQRTAESAVEPEASEAAAPELEIEVIVERFADLEVQRYEVPGNDELGLREKELSLYLAHEALAGRDSESDEY